MTSPLMLFNLGAQEIVILFILGLAGLVMVAVVPLVLFLGLGRRPPEEGGGAD
jgi:hypothetical protein